MRIQYPGAADAFVGPRGGGGGSPNRLYKAPTDYTKPQQLIQSPNRQYKAAKHYTKLQKSIQRHQDIRQNPKILDKDIKYLNKRSNKYESNV